MPPTKLPEDVERLVFETAAKWPDVNFKRIRNLLLVARRVHAWLETFLYESIFITSSNIVPISRALASKPLEFRQKVKTIMLMSADSLHHLTEEILHMCQGITKLSIEGWVPFLALAHLRPRKLSLMLDWITDEAGSSFDLPFFENVTHLELYTAYDFSQLKLAPLDRLPSLTHLALADLFPFEWGTEPVGALKKLAESCCRLQMIVLVFDDDDDIPDISTTLTSIQWPPIYQSTSQYFELDWVDHLSGKDIWTRASCVANSRTDKRPAHPP
jgi:hypothetical protein